MKGVTVGHSEIGPGGMILGGASLYNVLEHKWGGIYSLRACGKRLHPGGNICVPDLSAISVSWHVRRPGHRAHTGTQGRSTVTPR